MPPAPHSRDLRKGRWLESGPWFAVTTAVRDRRPLLDAGAGARVIEALLWLREHRRAQVFAFVVMPDHVHALLSPQHGHLLPSVMSSWKRHTARQITTGGLWQEGFYDHAIRDLEDAYRQRRYILENPVRKGWVQSAEEFELSSAHPKWSGRVDEME